MLIKFCPQCPDNPYTKDMQISSCPVCGTALQMASVSDSEMEERMEFPIGSNRDTEERYDEYEKQPEKDDDCRNDNSDETERNTVFVRATSKSSRMIGGVCVVGKVSQYRTCNDKSGNYRRLLPRKIYQAVVYGQRFEDLLHSFIVTEIKGSDSAGNPIQQKYVVNVHGSTNYGASIVDNEEVEVRGQFTHDNILMAREVKVINGNAATPVKFQRSVKLIAVFCIIAALLLLGLFAILNAGGGAMTNIWKFIVTMFAVYVILLILYLVASFTRLGFMVRLLSGGRSRKSPVLVMLIIAFVLTLLLYNVFGIGTAIGNMLVGAFGVVGPIIFMVIGIVILLKAIIK